MTKQNNKLTRTKSRDLLQGSLIALVIIASPYLFYSYSSFPDGPVWETSMFTYESKYQENMQFAMWIFLGKFVPILLLSIWFFTCKHWWFHSILIPLAMYVFQLINAINQDVNPSVDEVELVWLIPIMLIVVPLVYLIRAKLFNKMRGNDLESFEEELKQEKGLIGQLKDLFR